MENISSQRARAAHRRERHPRPQTPSGGCPAYCRSVGYRSQALEAHLSSSTPKVHRARPCLRRAAAMSDFTTIARGMSPPTTSPAGTPSDHTNAVLNIIFGTASAESRAQSLIVLVSDNRKSIWEHRDGAEKAFRSATSDLAAEQNKMSEREWQTIDLQFEGPFARLCQTSDKIDSL